MFEATHPFDNDGMVEFIDCWIPSSKTHFYESDQQAIDTMQDIRSTLPATAEGDHAAAILGAAILAMLKRHPLYKPYGKNHWTSHANHAKPVDGCHLCNR